MCSDRGRSWGPGDGSLPFIHVEPRGACEGSGVSCACVLVVVVVVVLVVVVAGCNSMPPDVDNNVVN